MTLPMRVHALFVSLVLTVSLASAQTAPAVPTTQQAPAPAPTTSPAPDAQSTPAAPAAAVPAQAGGTIHGTVKDGNIPLPGVSVTASNSLTGKRYSTTTDITGSYSLVIPQNGRYVLKTELSAFAPVTKEALLNATARDQGVDFSILLASRAAEQEQQTSLATAARQFAGAGAQSL
ncbi:MAG: carboxypeptidase-like regulatory domain-containing protein, partial [Acidobacteriaceae bacterium]